eukprot:m.126768 g.126768  ORF g.126768 m.126768 type:complete len:80 (+) comp13843_c0_seq3:946-1185(+)
MICVAYTAPMVDSGRRLELRMYLSSSDDLPEKAACSNSPSINHTNQLDLKIHTYPACSKYKHIKRDRSCTQSFEVHSTI